MNGLLTPSYKDSLSFELNPAYFPRVVAGLAGFSSKDRESL